MDTDTRTRILAIESSCDETAAAVIEDGRRILSNVISSQIDLHQKYGGVFPEMASRAHVEAITPVIAQAMADANATWDSITAVAVTRGPGLPGSLVVGVNAAKGICLARGLPLIGVNHLEGHIYSHFLETGDGGRKTDALAVAGLPSPVFEFPLLTLIVSGGHTELVLMRGHGDYELIGHTVDDAAGEAFDKVARMLGLGYPGGPLIQKAALAGNAERFKFARPRISPRKGGMVRSKYDGAFEFSFSGAKTAALGLIQQFGGNDKVNGKLSLAVPVEDIAASFQLAVVDWLVEKTALAVQQFGAKAVLVGGGVSANKLLREKMRAAFPDPAFPVSFPPFALCTDNAAMIGAAAHYAYVRGVRDTLAMDVSPDLKIGV
ncbi:MAG TPA: tRNA (adenosine(37)-N6)-threonylcarbamoyltransferase complex transferase subunit TsaD [Thermoflexales bacterium]|nr:tRNA (adenosine(37)-N6)-threonylcarbamoyltransferase complex transferase subunit TsaD [Thermoflexales bacterium]